jgi:hypothetical protein
MDEEGENDRLVREYSLGTTASDLVNGRTTLFCCLCCGIPFALPDDSYIYQQNNKDVRHFIWFTHYVRRQLRLYDRSRASTKQWQLELSHYLHSYLHKNILASSLSGGGEYAADGPPKNAWDNQESFVAAAVQLISSIKEATGCCSPTTSTMTKPPIIDLSDEQFLNYKNSWCNACNIAATHAIRIKQILGIKKKTDRVKGVPCNPMHLPLGMRAMHDTYLFIYLVASFLSVLLSRSMSPDISQTEAFRHDCLIRLYTSYLIYTLATKLSDRNIFPGVDMSFEHWHMFYFNDLQLWERQKKGSVSDLRTNLRYFYNNSNDSPNNDSSSSWHSFVGLPLSVGMNYGEQRSAIEIIQRVTHVVKKHWYVLDIQMPLTSKNRLDASKVKEHRDFHDWLPWKHDANRTVQNVTSNPAANLAPAPFCCINDEDFFRQNYDESVSSRVERKMYFQDYRIPLSLFFHRMYVNMDMHFGSRQDLHNAMARQVLFFSCIVLFCPRVTTPRGGTGTYPACTGSCRLRTGRRQNSAGVQCCWRGSGRKTLQMKGICPAWVAFNFLKLLLKTQHY